MKKHALLAIALLIFSTNVRSDVPSARGEASIYWFDGFGIEHVNHSDGFGFFFPPVDISHQNKIITGLVSND